MTLHLTPHPVAMEPARAAAVAAYRRATGGQKTRALKHLQDKTTEVLRVGMEARDG